MSIEVTMPQMGESVVEGTVTKWLVKQGDRVEAGQPIVTLEAMKMEHVHVAPVSGIILAIDVVEAEQVTTGKIVAMIEARQPGDSELDNDRQYRRGA